eukprot:COSAG02_NODE_354_length_24016_cov_208.299231_12_plen_79_part_00
MHVRINWMRLRLRQQQRVKIFDSLPGPLVNSWREPLDQRHAIERSTPHHVALAVVMCKLFVSQHPPPATGADRGPGAI